MRKIIVIILIIWALSPLSSAQADLYLAGRILLQVEQNGEAWYWEPVSDELIYLGRPKDAFQVMRAYGLGVSEVDFAAIQTAVPARLFGRIILQVEQNGEAWYANPVDQQLYFLGRPADAFDIMRELGLGVSETDLAAIQAKEYSSDNAKKDQEIPFTSQAPTGAWSNQRFHDACEETSVLMAAAWARGFTFGSDEARKQILALSEYAGNELGEWRDQSIDDTARLLAGYYDYQNYQVLSGTIEDMIAAVQGGAVVIAPFDGRKLGNPFYTEPGPAHHMMLIHGWDEATGEFVVHDPGTRHGENYHYVQAVIDQAWRDYPTGYHEDFGEQRQKMLVIQK